MIEQRDLNPNQILDAVLTACIPTKIAGRHPLAIDFRLNDAGIKLSSNKLHQALKKLIKDGYVLREESVDGSLDYLIAFEGEVLLSNGGYNQASKSLGAERKRHLEIENLAITNGRRLNTLTLYLVIASSALALFELIKFVRILCGYK